MATQGTFEKVGTRTVTVAHRSRQIDTYQQVEDPLVQFPTRLTNETAWETILADHVEENQISVDDTTVTLDLDGTYTVSCGTVGTNQQRAPAATYVINSVTTDEGDKNTIPVTVDLATTDPEATVRLVGVKSGSNTTTTAEAVNGTETYNLDATGSITQIRVELGDGTDIVQESRTIEYTG